MLFKNITLLDENFQIRENMYVGIDGDKITYISNEFPAADFGTVYDGKGKLLMPGFVNTHAHSPMSLLRGYGENMALQDWLNKRIFPFEDKLTGEAVYWGTMLSMAESIRYGIVSTTDMYYFAEDMICAIEESGTKNNLSRSVTCFSDADLWELESAKEMKDIYERFHNYADGKIKVDMSIHAEYTSNPKIVQQMAEYTKEIGANMHVHMSETKLEHEECKQRHGKTPAAYFNSLGLFDTPTTAAHCVWLEPDDYPILKEKGVTPIAAGFADVGLEYMIDELVLSEGGSAEHSYQPSFGVVSSWERAINDIKTLEAAGAFTANCYNVNFESAVQDFLDGKAAMIVAPSTAFGGELPADDVKVVGFPTTPTGKREAGAFVGRLDHGFYISTAYFNSGDRERDSIFELMNTDYLGGADFYEIFKDESTFCPNPEYYADYKETKMDDALNALVSKAEVADWPMRDRIITMDTTVDSFRKALTGTPVEEALQAAADAEIAAIKAEEENAK